MNTLKEIIDANIAAREAKIKMSVKTRKAGVSFQAMEVLFIVYEAGQTGISPTDVAITLVTEKAGVSRYLSKLSDYKYIKLHNHKDDRRRVSCLIMPKGAALIERVSKELLKKSVSKF